MSDEEFTKHIDFLKEEISKHPDKSELILKYMDLISLRIECDKELQKHEVEKSTKLAEVNAQLQSTIHTNNTNAYINTNNNNAATQQNYNNNYASMHINFWTQSAGTTNHLISNYQQMMPHIANHTPIAIDYNQNTNLLIGNDSKD